MVDIGGKEITRVVFKNEQLYRYFPSYYTAEQMRREILTLLKINMESFNRQIKSLERYAKDHDIEYLIDFTEEKSAKNFTDRPQFKKLDKLLQAGDTVVFKDLYRFTREAENGYKKYMEWLDRGINMVFLDNPTVSSVSIYPSLLKMELLQVIRGVEENQASLIIKEKCNLNNSIFHQF